jgi:hypothetical protein
MTVQTEAPEEMSLFSSLEGLRSAKSTHRLNQIARIRANGVGDHISLPQLVVCGYQSAGKSSVLEGITGIPFPRQDGVCTKSARLMAEVQHRLNGNFANYVRENGQKRKLCNRDPSELSAGSETESEEGDGLVLVNKQELNKQELNKQELNKQELNKQELNKQELNKQELNKQELNS